MESAITVKGQATIPKAIRKHLRLKPGDRAIAGCGARQGFHRGAFGNYVAGCWQTGTYNLSVA